MRLSDAIALGRTLLLPWDKNNSDAGHGCAMMLAGAAMGNALDWSHWDYAWKPGSGVPLPCTCQTELYGVGLSLNTRAEIESGSFRQQVFHMFNHHVYQVQDWNLDQLIDWIRSVEPVPQAEGRLAGSAPASEVPQTPVLLLDDSRHSTSRLSQS